jgi:hypothetical protein
MEQQTTQDAGPSTTYVATIDAEIEAARDALRAIDPASSLARRLAPLGVDDEPIDVEPHGRCERAFALRWRLCETGRLATVHTRIRLGADGVGRTMLSVAMHADAGDHDALAGVLAAWPALETVALAHARSLRRTVDESTADRCAADELPRTEMLTAAA